MKRDDTYPQLITYIKNAKHVAVAFSGGVDSALLTYLAHKELGDNMMAITVKTPYTPVWEIEEALQFVKEYGIPHQVITLPIPSNITQNPPDRCYLCKIEIFEAILSSAKEHNIHTIFDGSNKDDLSDYRPGMRALKELNIESPMLQLGISKVEIRELSHKLLLKTWDKPSCACLLSRIPYHTEITIEELDRISKAEQILRHLKIIGSRVRSHGDIARIEVPIRQLTEIVSLDQRTQLVEKIKDLGYLYVVVDLEGYETGSLNKTLNIEEHHE
jgi:uncharacterized protein